MSKHALERIKDKIRFEQYELRSRTCSKEQQQELSSLPKLFSVCRLRMHPKARSSAYGQMWEYVMVGGYTQTPDGIKALVIFTERESADIEEPDWLLVPATSLLKYKPERVKEFSL